MEEVAGGLACVRHALAWFASGGPELRSGRGKAGRLGKSMRPSRFQFPNE